MPSPLRSAVAGGISALTVGAVAAGGELFALSPYGSDAWLLASFAAVVPLILCVVLLPLAILLLVPTRTRSIAENMVAFGAVMILGLVFSIFLANYLRIDAFGRLAARSVPLVTAIHAFEKDHSRPPATLGELVPRYLSAIPNTGMGAYPEYRYATGPETMAGMSGNNWVIFVDASRGLLNWDIFIYYPNQRYPRSGFGGVLQRVGEWAYVHE